MTRPKQQSYIGLVFGDLGKELLPAKIPKHISLTVWKMFRKKKKQQQQKTKKQNKQTEEHNYYKYGSCFLEPKSAGQFHVGFCWQLCDFLSLRGLFNMVFLVLFVFCGALWRSMFSCLVLFSALTLCVVGPVWPCDDLDGI